jgi:hypothetical protein
MRVTTAIIAFQLLKILFNAFRDKTFLTMLLKKLKFETFRYKYYLPQNIIFI